MTSTRIAQGTTGVMTAIAMALVVLLTGSRGALAAEDPAALIEQGKALRMAGDEDGAYKLLSRAYALSPTPRAAGQLGMCERNLSHWFEAETHIAEALRATSDPWVQRNQAALRSEIDIVRTHLAKVEIVGEPSGAEVEVGGQLVGRLPLGGPVRVIAGEVNVRVTAPGYKTLRKDVTVGPMDSERVTVDLVAAPVKSAPPPVTTGAPPTEARETGMSAPADSGQWKRPVGWAAAGTAVVLATVGVAALVVSTNRIDQFNKYDQAPGTADMKCNTVVKGNGGSVCSSLLDQGNQAQTIGYVSIGAAVAAGVVSVVLLLSAPSGDATAALPTHSRTLASFDCAPILDRARTGAQCGWRF